MCKRKKSEQTFYKYRSFEYWVFFISWCEGYKRILSVYTCRNVYNIDTPFILKKRINNTHTLNDLGFISITSLSIKRVRSKHVILILAVLFTFDTKFLVINISEKKLSIALFRLKNYTCLGWDLHIIGKMLGYPCTF